MSKFQQFTRIKWEVTKSQRNTREKEDDQDRALHLQLVAAEDLVPIETRVEEVVITEETKMVPQMSEGEVSLTKHLPKVALLASLSKETIMVAAISARLLALEMQEVYRWARTWAGTTQKISKLILLEALVFREAWDNAKTSSSTSFHLQIKIQWAWELLFMREESTWETCSLT